MSFVTGYEYRFLLVLIVFAFILAMTYITRQRKELPFVRPMPGMDGLKELVGRAAEMAGITHWELMRRKRSGDRAG